MPRDRLREMASFGLVGGIGFAVDGGLLTVLVALGAGPIEARAVSFPAAVLATWALNRLLTFTGRNRAGSAVGEYGRYFAVQIAGALVNLALYAGLLAAVPALAAMPLVPLALAAAAAFLVNYRGARHFAFAPA